MRIVNRAHLSPDELSEIESVISGQQNLKDVMQWALADKSGAFIPGIVEDVIVQDEYTHDVVIPWRDALVLVYDTT